jgi:diguanylate cyclase (GGDEF)-like protein
MASATHRLHDRDNKKVGGRIPSRISARSAKPNRADWAAILRPERPGGLDDRFTFERAVADHFDGGRSCAVLLFNIDGLSLINTHFGDAVGNRMIGRFAGRLREVEPLAKSIASFGSDDLAVLIVGADTSFDAEGVALRFMRVLDVPCFFDIGALLVSPSIGIAQAPFHGQDATSLIHAASDALCAAKAAGGHVWRISEVTTTQMISQDSEMQAKATGPRCGSADTLRDGAGARKLDHSETVSDGADSAIGGGVTAAMATGIRALGRLGVAMALLLHS